MLAFQEDSPRSRIPPSLLFFLTVFLLEEHVAAPRSAVTGLFLIGDSSVNCGDNDFMLPFLQINTTSSLCADADTPLVPDFLSEKLGLPRVPPFYGMNRTTEGVVNGLNFGSLTAGLLSSERRFTFQGVNTQLRQALEVMQLLQITYGQDRARELASRSLFYISAGANDYLRLFLPNVSGVQSRFRSKAFARFLVRQTSRVIKDLYNADVRKIVCAGIAPLGCTPRLLWERYDSSLGSNSIIMEAGCVEDVNKLTLEFNELLSSEIIKLQGRLPGSVILFCDVYQGIMNIVREPRRFGFSNVKNACCGVGPYGGKLGCRRDGTVCSDRNTRVWWDLYNPTAATNSLLAEWMWADGPLSICAPISIHHLVFM